MVLLIFTTLIFFAYGSMMVYYNQAWRKIPEERQQSISTPIKISIIIPARNEEKNIGRLLKTIEEQNYPRKYFEVIVVDDHSTDRTAEIAWSFEDVRIIQLKEDGINSYKKMALAAGIAKATGDLVVTTDADCLPPPSWLESIAACRERTGAKFIVAPVVMQQGNSIVEIFQAIDFLTLQGITAVAVTHRQFSMCNGANLAYDKDAFYAVDGFAGIDHIASGDDMLLMQKIEKQFPGSTHYLKSRQAIVRTLPMKTWKDFFNQRIRWASKARFYQEKNILLVLALVYLFNVCFLLLLIAGLWWHFLWLVLFILWVGKTFVEIPFVYGAARFFGKLSLMPYFFLFQPFHIFYTLLAGWLGLVGKYEWKGRKVR
jgi:cellulose synthase/poly-beta-1,6-N-acetylglucosamine synthase-like glycosyltransferase